MDWPRSPDRASVLPPPAPNPGPHPAPLPASGAPQALPGLSSAPAPGQGMGGQGLGSLGMGGLQSGLSRAGSSTKSLGQYNPTTSDQMATVKKLRADSAANGAKVPTPTLPKPAGLEEAKSPKLPPLKPTPLKPAPPQQAPLQQKGPLRPATGPSLLGDSAREADYGYDFSKNVTTPDEDFARVMDKDPKDWTATDTLKALYSKLYNSRDAASADARHDLAEKVQGKFDAFHAHRDAPDIDSLTSPESRRRWDAFEDGKRAEGAGQTETTAPSFAEWHQARFGRPGATDAATLDGAALDGAAGDDVLRGGAGGDAGGDNSSGPNRLAERQADRHGRGGVEQSAGTQRKEPWTAPPVPAAADVQRRGEAYMKKMDSLLAKPSHERSAEEVEAMRQEADSLFPHATKVRNLAHRLLDGDEDLRPEAKVQTLDRFREQALSPDLYTQQEEAERYLSFNPKEQRLVDRDKAAELTDKVESGIIQAGGLEQRILEHEQVLDRFGDGQRAKPGFETVVAQARAEIPRLRAAQEDLMNQSVKDAVGLAGVPTHPYPDLDPYGATPRTKGEEAVELAKVGVELAGGKAMGRLARAAPGVARVAKAAGGAVSFGKAFTTAHRANLAQAMKDRNLDRTNPEDVKSFVKDYPGIAAKASKDALLTATLQHYSGKVADRLSNRMDESIREFGGVVIEKGLSGVAKISTRKDR
ncbi:MAG: hypothetical protein ACPGNT_07240 [Rhodospirillales bacterium]